MAAVNPEGISAVAHLHLIDDEHPAWVNAFPTEIRSAQISEDLFAARTVGGVLFTIVTIGAILGALSVLLATALW